MSENEIKCRSSNKRKAESDDEDEKSNKKERISPPPPPIEIPSESEIRHSRKSIEEAIKALDRIQYEFNMGNVLADSPEPSDQDTPPESEDDEELLNNAHAMGFAACLRETFSFLESLNVAENDPIYIQLKSRFAETSN